jgi:two-component system, OmpR family, sensor histidine kinase ArlS
MSIKYKIAFLFASLVTVFFAIASVSIYFFSAKERDQSFKIRLKNRAFSTAKVYEGISDKNFSVLQQMDAGAVASLYEKSITIVGNGNSYEYMFSDKPGDSLFLSQDIIERAKIDNEYYFKKKSKRIIAIYNVNNINSNGSFVIAVSASDIDGEEYLRQLKGILAVTVLLAMMLSFYVGLMFAKKMIRPIKKITGEVNLITSSNLSQRIKVKAAKDELTTLAQTFNDLLDRLQDSFAIQRRFISNASHELSTPLTSVSSQLEVAMQKRRTREEYISTMQSVYEDIKALQVLTRSLLDIAKMGSHGSIDLNEVRVDEVLFKTISDIKKQNETYKVKIDFEELPADERSLSVFANANLLYIAFRNIIENGCKYSDDHQSSVKISAGEINIIIDVINNGDVIAEADIQNVFQPFFRSDSAQQKPGFGLGLTLAKRILLLHKGTINVQSDLEKGTIFTICLPHLPAIT